MDTGLGQLAFVYGQSSVTSELNVRGVGGLNIIYCCAGPLGGGPVVAPGLGVLGLFGSNVNPWRAAIAASVAGIFSVDAAGGSCTVVSGEIILCSPVLFPFTGVVNAFLSRSILLGYGDSGMMIVVIMTAVCVIMTLSVVCTIERSWDADSREIAGMMLR